MKKEWKFGGFLAKIFRWTTDFSPVKEPSIMLVWVSFPLLPMHFCKKDILLTLGKAVGNPLKLDLATAAMERVLQPSEARLCIEVDVQKELPNRVWIGTKEKGKWQQIMYEDLPEYCTACSKIGHSILNCKHKPSTKVWVPKKNSEDIGKASHSAAQVDQVLHSPPPHVVLQNSRSAGNPQAVAQEGNVNEQGLGKPVEGDDAKQALVIWEGSHLRVKNMDWFFSILGQLLELINGKERSPEDKEAKLKMVQSTEGLLQTEGLVEELAALEALPTAPPLYQGWSQLPFSAHTGWTRTNESLDSKTLRIVASILLLMTDKGTS